MLMQLRIENVAVIEKAVIEFTNGFNVLTGETGAGKSIIIDSLNAVTGERTSKDVIRYGAEKATISAIFCDICAEASETVSDFGVEISDDGIFTLNRVISKDGKSIFRINGTIVPMSAVRQISPYLINIHGQHDNQQLFTPSKHISFIDGFANIANKVKDYSEIYKKICELREKLKSIDENSEYKIHRKEILQFQIDEIDSAELKSGEEEELLKLRDTIRNSQQLNRNISMAGAILNGNQESDGVIDSIRQSAEYLREISEYSDSVSQISKQIDSVVFELEEIISEIQETDGVFDFDKSQSDYVDERLDVIYGLKQKYGSTVDEILKHCENLKRELDEIDFDEQNREEYQKQYNELSEKARELAKSISLLRRKASSELCKSITNELIFLDMPNVTFSVEHKETELKSDGCDQMEFLVSANKGEIPKPLAKIASGGELSRIMLAIKNVLSKSDPTGTLIFDEIDSGVSGKTARKIGEKMKLISNEKQVICVTHLAQIASLSDTHLFISKKTENERTYTSVKTLDKNERIYEVARIMGGEAVTQATLNAAKELLQSDSVI